MTKAASDQMGQRLSRITENLRTLHLLDLLSQVSSGDNCNQYERECLKRCLETCVRMSTSIDKQSKLDSRVTNTLGEYQEKLRTTILGLDELLKSIEEQNIFANFATNARVQGLERGQVRVDAWHERAQCRTNTLENVYVGEDGRQSILSTIGDLISARNVSAGARSVQCIGQLSDASIQELLHTQP